MPVVDGSAKPVRPAIEVGPYIILSENGALELRFRTNTRCVVGLRFGGDDRIQRFGSGKIEHAIRLSGFAPGAERYCRIMLDDIEGPAIRLRAPVSPGKPVTLAFGGGSGADGAFYGQAGDRLSDIPLDGFIMTAEPFNQNVDLKEWGKRVFSPMQAVFPNTPIHFIPGARENVPEKLFPWRKAEEVAWRKQIGCVYLIGIDTRVFKNASEAQLIIEWLDKALAARQPSAAWTVLVTPEPLLGSDKVNAAALNALGDKLEQGGVDLVISGGATAYHRTQPLTMNGVGPIRYIVTNGLGPLFSGNSGREYTAVSSDTPNVCVMHADTGGLAWTAIGMNGKVVDSFELAVGGEKLTGEPVAEKQDILTQALAVTSLKREIVSVARQTCRAVLNPGGQQELALRIENPSPMNFSGRLVWAKGEKARWDVNPGEKTFDLKPGQAMILPFTASPKSGGELNPELLIDAPGVGYMRQPLVIVKRKTARIPIVDSRITANGRFVEDAWKQAAEMKGFADLHTGEKPAHELFCSVMAAANGLVVGFQCEADRPASMTPQARRHDAPVNLDESVEIFIDTGMRARDFMQFAVNVKGIKLDRSSRYGISWNPPWMPSIRHGRTEGGVTYYNAELIIPYRSLGLQGPPKNGDQWAINFVRNDYKPRKTKAGEAAPAQTVQWAPTYGSNTRSGLYGIVTFYDPKMEKNKAEKK